MTLTSTHDFSGPRNGMMKKATGFFSEALVPIEEDARANRDSLANLKAKARACASTPAALSAANRQLRSEVARRRRSEEAVKKGKERYYRLLVQSQHMQEKLRRLARQVLSAQEDERRNISRELQRRGRADL